MSVNGLHFINFINYSHLKDVLTFLDYPQMRTVGYNGLILKNKNHNNLQALANHELTIINDCMKYNRLSLNYKKSTYFISALKQKKVALQNF